MSPRDLPSLGLWKAISPGDAWRITNMVEFQNKGLKERTRTIRVFPNKEALLRVASVLLVELDDKWLSKTKAYI